MYSKNKFLNNYFNCLPACHVTIDKSQRSVNMQMWYELKIFILKSQG